MKVKDPPEIPELFQLLVGRFEGKQKHRLIFLPFYWIFLLEGMWVFSKPNPIFLLDVFVRIHSMFFLDVLVTPGCLFGKNGRV